MADPRRRLCRYYIKVIATSYVVIVLFCGRQRKQFSMYQIPPRFQCHICHNFKVHLTQKNVFRSINSMHVEYLNSEIFLVFNVALVSYRDLNVQNANKMTSIQDSFIIQLLVFTSK